MTAQTAQLPSSLSAEQRAHEPSMDEILASIRRIIADDAALPLTVRPPANVDEAPAVEPPQAATSAAPVADAPHIQVVRDMPAAPQNFVIPPVPHVPAAEDMVAEEMVADEPVAEAAVTEVPVVAAPVHDQGAYEDQAEAAASEAAYAEETYAEEAEPYAGESHAGAAYAADAPQSEWQDAVHEQLLSPTADASISGAFQALATTMFVQNTGMVESALRDMLRPMLKQWLDDNLPVMVERLVRSEIERVARGGRG